MDYTKLKKEIKEISGIANSVPERLQEKCFEILLNNLLGAPGIPPDAKVPPYEDGKTDVQVPTADLPITTQLRVFMAKTNINKEDINQIIMVADGNVHFLSEPGHGKITKGQKAWALLLALENCILNNSLSVDPEKLRSICQNKGFYDQANFATNLKAKNFASLFKGKMKGQGEAQELSNHGQDELAKLIKQLGLDA